MSEQQSTAPWQAVGASVVGAVHIRAGKPCQDAIQWYQEGEFVVLAVADGHGSEHSPYSDTGARIAVEVAVQLLSGLYRNSGWLPGRLSAVKRYAEEQLPKAIVREWIERVKDRHGTEGRDDAQSDKGLLIQYGSTLLAALLAKEFLLLLQLGDGDILVVDDDGHVVRPIPKDERLIGNETTSMATPDAWREVRVHLAPILDRSPALVLLATDGYANSFVSETDFLQAGVDYLELIREQGLKQVASHLEEWLNDASLQGSGDDITVGLAFRMTSGRQSEE